MKPFEFKMKTKIFFGEHKLEEIGGICAGCHSTNVLVLCDPFLRDMAFMKTITDSIDKCGISWEIFSDIVPDPPVELVDDVAAMLKSKKIDMVVAVGGGSTLDTAKSISMLQTNEGSVRDYLFGGTKEVKIKGIPVCCVPTTAGTGSEVTSASVITDTQTNNKLSVTNDLIIPDYAVIDPITQVSMPAKITAMTGMDVLTHAIESYVSLKADPVADLLALEAIGIVSRNLRTAVHDGSNMEARMAMAYASTLGGICILNSTVGAVHGIAQSMGGVAHTAHGLANAILLPYVMKKNLPANIKKYKDIAVALGEPVEGLSDRDAAEKSIAAVERLIDDIGIPKKMREVNITEDMLPQILDLTMNYRLLALNPRKLNREDIDEILKEAF